MLAFGHLVIKRQYQRLCIGLISIKEHGNYNLMANKWESIDLLKIWIYRKNNFLAKLKKERALLKYIKINNQEGLKLNYVKKKKKQQGGKFQEICLSLGDGIRIICGDSGELVLCLSICWRHWPRADPYGRPTPYEVKVLPI